MHTKLRYIFLLLVLSLLWAGLFVFVKIGGRNILPFTLMAWRAILGFFFIFFILCIQKKIVLMKAQLSLRPQLLFLFNGLCITFMWFTIAKSEEVITVAMSSFLLSTLAVFSWVIATFFTREKPFYLFNLCGIIIAAFGVAIMLGPENIVHGNKNVWYALLYVIGILVFVIGVATIKHFGIKTSPMISIFYSLFYAMLILTLCAFFFEDPLRAHYTSSVIISIIGLGIFSTGIGYIIFFSLVIYAGQVFAALNGYLVPIFGFILGAFFMRETYTLYQILALLVVFIGMLATNRSKPEH
jgi:drug/metabolite transporter (DMT)-like permease